MTFNSWKDKQTPVYPYNGNLLSNPSIRNELLTCSARIWKVLHRWWRNQFQKVTYFYVTFWKSKTVVMENRSDCQRLQVGRRFDNNGTTQKFWRGYPVSWQIFYILCETVTQIYTCTKAQRNTRQKYVNFIVYTIFLNTRFLNSI